MFQTGGSSNFCEFSEFFSSALRPLSILIHTETAAANTSPIARPIISLKKNGFVGITRVSSSYSSYSVPENKVGSINCFTGNCVSKS